MQSEYLSISTHDSKVKHARLYINTYVYFIGAQLITFNQMPIAYPPPGSPHVASIALVEQHEPMQESEYERLEYRHAVELACVRHSALYAPAPSPSAGRSAPATGVCVVPVCVGWNNNMYQYCTAYGVPVNQPCASGILRFARPEHIGADTVNTQAATQHNRLIRHIYPEAINEVNSEDGIIYDNFAREPAVKASTAMSAMLNACQPQTSEFDQTKSRPESDPLETSDTYMTAEEVYQNGHPSNPNRETQLSSFASGHLQNSPHWQRQVNVEVSKEAETEVLSKGSGKTLRLEYRESSTPTPDELMQTAGEAASLRRKQTQFAEAHV